MVSMKCLWVKHLAVYGLWVCTMMGGGASLEAARQGKPNIVLIISDDQAWSDYGFMGHPTIRTPHLDRLSQQSVLYTRGYVPTALCRPSLMTLVTGRYAHEHGVTGNDPSPKYAAPSSELYRQRRTRLISYLDRFDTLPELLAEQGYLSHQSGKWWEGSFRHGGFTHGMTRGFPEAGGRHGDEGLKIGREGMKSIETFVDTAIDQDKPFFLWYAPFLPHSPHNPPVRLLEHYQAPDRSETIAKYDAMCEWFDETCGQLMGYLEHKGVREETLIVYVADNGWVQDPDSSRYASRSKQTPYEGGVRTPIMFSWPGHLEPSSRTDLVSSIDLVPTLLAVAGARMPKDLPGLDLLPYLRENKALERSSIFGEGFAHDIADVDHPEASLLYRWVIEDRWKLLLTYDGEVHRYASTHPRTETRPQLFDLLKDPWESSNVAGERPEIVARLVEQLGAWYPVKERRVITAFDSSSK